MKQLAALFVVAFTNKNMLRRFTSSTEKFCLKKLIILIVSHLSDHVV